MDRLEQSYSEQLLAGDHAVTPLGLKSAVYLMKWMGGKMRRKMGILSVM
jgi:hypothetical protein